MKKLMYFVVVICLILSCEKNENSITKKSANFSGFVQKGPFVTGSEIVVQELDDQLTPTGITYHTMTIDDFGSFSLESEIQSNFVDVIADGFYFNEVSGEISNASIKLRYISHVAEELNSNINILTTLAKERIEYLMKENSHSFSDAKTQAQREILRIFNIPDSLDVDFAEMDISNNTDSDAILLAISSILQGDNSEGELSEYINKFILDIKEDGTLDNPSLTEELILNSEDLDLNKIRSNLMQRYKDLGLSIVISPFEKYVQLLHPFKVINIYHGNNSSDILLDDTISISFNKPVDVGTISESSIYIKQGDNIVNSTYIYNNSNSYEIKIIPSILLTPNSSYQLIISDELKALDQSNLPTYEYSFNTISVDIENGLKAHYIFNGTAEDITLNGYHALLNEAFYRNDRFGNSEGCVEFTKRGDYVEFPNIFNLSKLDWSYSIWFNIQATPEFISFLLGTENGSCAFGEHPFYFGQSRNLFTYSNGKHLKYEISLEEGTWYHGVIIINHGRVEFYVNGELVTYMDGYINSNSGGSFNHYSGKYYISEHRTCDNYSAMIGYADDVRFYDRALNKFEVEKIYNTEK